MTAAKVREDRTRRQLWRRYGFLLQRSRARDPLALTFGGYQIACPATGEIIFGHGNRGFGFALTLDDVDVWMKHHAED